MSDWGSPVPGAPTVSGSNLFGEPRTGHTHAGWDINAPGWTGGPGFGAGTPIRAAGGGTVHYNHTSSGGYIVNIVHDNGWTTSYMHLGTKDGSIGPYAVVDGGRVEAGQVIGYMGDTGNPQAGAFHLHFEIRDPRGSAVDPATVGFGGTAGAAGTQSDQYGTILRTMLDEMSLAAARGQRLTPEQAGVQPWDAASLFAPDNPEGPPLRTAQEAATVAAQGSPPSRLKWWGNNGR